jgi:FkbM family methyltransferase
VSVEALKRDLVQRPGDAAILGKLARVARAHAEHEAAAWAYRLLCVVTPGDRNAWWSFVSVLNSLGRFDDASRYLDPVRHSDRFNPYGILERLNFGGECPDLRALLRKRIVEYPSDIRYLVVLVRYLTHKGQADPGCLVELVKRCGAGARADAPVLDGENFLKSSVALKRHFAATRDFQNLVLCNAMGMCCALERFPGLARNRYSEGEVEISVGGQSMHFQLEEPSGFRAFENFFAYEPSLFEWIKGFRDTDVLIDVGANIGKFSILPAMLSGCRVIGFEPIGVNYRTLMANIRRNHLNDRVTALNVALSDEDGWARIEFPQETPGIANASIVERSSDASTMPREDIRKRKLDSLIADGTVPQPNHVKIDVDGYEAEVLAGMARTLADPRLVSIRIEIKPRDPRRPALVTRLTEMGFRGAVADDLKNLVFHRQR